MKLKRIDLSYGKGKKSLSIPEPNLAGFLKPISTDKRLEADEAFTNALDNPIGNEKLAKIVFAWIQDKIFEDGSYWCGYTFPDMVIWPEEKITWTNAVVLIAADAIYNLTPAGRLFNHEHWGKT